MLPSAEKKKARVLILTCAKDVSGPVKGVFQFLNLLRGEIDYFLFNIRSSIDCCATIENGALKEGLTLGSFDHTSRFDRRILKDVEKYVVENNITVIQTHGYKPSIIGLYIKLKTGIRWVCFFHGLTTENLKVKLYHWLDRLVQLFADKVVIVSEDMRKQILSRWNSKRIVVIRNAIDSATPSVGKYGGDVIRRQLGINDEQILLIVVGRLSPEKGIDIFLEALVQLREKINNIYAVIVGEGQERPVLIDFVSSNHLGEIVRFCGFKENVGDYLEASDIVVLPSRSEGIPNVLLEAMAFGKPVVATSVGGIPEVLTNRKEGLLVPPESPQSLARAVFALVKDKQTMFTYGESGKKTVEQHFTPDARKRQILSVYDDVLSTIK